MKQQEAKPPLTLRDMARRAGVSLATDRVLHNSSGVRSDTASRVNEAIERNRFQPHMAASELARGRVPRSAFVLRLGLNVFMQQILSYLGEMVSAPVERRTRLENRPIVGKATQFACRIGPGREELACIWEWTSARPV